MKRILYGISILAISNGALACKDRIPASDYPLGELDNSSILVEVRVLNLTESTGSWYKATESFKATVLQSFKGDLLVGKAIDVSAAKEDAHAVCPVSVDKGQTYILVLHKRGSGIEISRFNILVNSQDENYQKFIQQIKNAKSV